MKAWTQERYLCRDWSRGLLNNGTSCSNYNCKRVPEVRFQRSEMKTVRFLVLSLTSLLHFIVIGNAVGKEASCPTLPCNSCQCESKPFPRSISMVVKARRYCQSTKSLRRFREYQIEVVVRQEVSVSRHPCCFRRVPIAEYVAEGLRASSV